MGHRERDPRLQKLFDEGKKVYSISKLNTIDNCQYEAWCTYVKHMKGTNGIYGILGTKLHDKLEEIINEKAVETELIGVLNEELHDLDMLGIDFPKDFKGGTSIRDNWVADMKHLCKTFAKPNGIFQTEQLFILKINEDRYVQGYIDLIKIVDESTKTISIYDWKTSTDFSKTDLLHHGRQLITYVLGKEQEGYNVKEIAWIMLKYVSVTFMGKAKSNSKNKTQLTKIINRGKLILELKPYILSDLDELGFDDVDIEIIINKAVAENSFDLLPDQIKSKYVIKPYVRKYDLTEELRQETLNYINKMADLFESKSEDEFEWKPKNMYILNSKGEEKEDTFYDHTLCNHRKTCPHIKKFDEMKTIQKANDEDLF